MHKGIAGSQAHLPPNLHACHPAHSCPDLLLQRLVDESDRDVRKHEMERREGTRERERKGSHTAGPEAGDSVRSIFLSDAVEHENRRRDEGAGT